MYLHHIQGRYPTDAIKTGKKLIFQGEEYELGASIPPTLQRPGLPIGVVVNGYTRQYPISSNGERVGEAWFYFYTSFEGIEWAILDEMLLYDMA